MSIIKIGPKVKFTTLSNQLINDPSLSPEELGMMAYLLSKPEDWEVRVSQLCSRFNMGKDRAYRILKDLIELGWIQKQENRTTTARFSGVEYIVLSEKSDTIKSDATFTDAKKPDPTKEREEQKTEKNKPIVPSLRSATRLASKKPLYPTDYERLWSTFPKHPNASKLDALKAWIALDEQDREDCLRGAGLYAAFLARERQKDPEFKALHLSTFINGRRWEAQLEAAAPQQCNGAVSLEEKRAKFEAWKLQQAGGQL